MYSGPLNEYIIETPKNKQKFRNCWSVQNEIGRRWTYSPCGTWDVGAEKFPNKEREEVDLSILRQHFNTRMRHSTDVIVCVV